MAPVPAERLSCWADPRDSMCRCRHEAAALAESYGLNAKDFFNVITSTIFANPTYKDYGGWSALAEVLLHRTGTAGR